MIMGTGIQPGSMKNPDNVHETETRSHRIVAVAVWVQSVALAVITGLDGSPVWRGARVLLIIAATVGLSWSVRRARPRSQGLLVLITGSVGVIVGVGIGVLH